MDTVKAYFTAKEVERAQLLPVPHHVAIIPDGNRRWAKNQGWKAVFGHKRGSQVLVDIVGAAIELKIKILTVYTFSTENWRRPPDEIASLMHLLKDYLVSQRPRMVAQSVRLSHIGNVDKLPLDVQEELKRSEKATEKGEELTLVLAINYGGRDELLRSVSRLVQASSQGIIDPSLITEELFKSYLDTASYPDPDLVIRTSGEFRLSNFLLWQLAYAEIHISSTLWPDYTPREFYQTIELYQKREQRLGE